MNDQYTPSQLVSQSAIRYTGSSYTTIIRVFFSTFRHLLQVYCVFVFSTDGIDIMPTKTITHVFPPVPALLRYGTAMFRASRKSHYRSSPGLEGLRLLLGFRRLCRRLHGEYNRQDIQLVVFVTIEGTKTPRIAAFTLSSHLLRNQGY